MGLKASSKGNGTEIAGLAYRLKGTDNFVNVGAVIYYRSHEAKIRLDALPVAAWRQGEYWLIGSFISTEKVPEAPYLDGDIVAKTDARGERVKVGHLHTREKRGTSEVQYFLEIQCMPVGQWREAIINGEEGRAGLFLEIQLN